MPKKTMDGSGVRQMTRHDRYLAALKARGWIVNEAAKTNKYTEMMPGPNASYGEGARRAPQAWDRIYIGSAGALRHGKTVNGSIPFSDAFKARLLAAKETA